MHFFTGMHIHGLAHAASGYHRVLEENRKLYNQVQDLKGKLYLHKFYISFVSLYSVLQLIRKVIYFI